MGKSNSKQTYDALRSISIILIRCICLCILLWLLFSVFAATCQWSYSWLTSQTHAIWSIPRMITDRIGLDSILIPSCISKVHKINSFKLFKISSLKFLPPRGKKLSEIAPPKKNLLLNNSVCDQRILHIRVMAFTANGQNFWNFIYLVFRLEASFYDVIISSKPFAHVSGLFSFRVLHIIAARVENSISFLF